MPRHYSMANRAEATGHTRRRIEAALIRLLGSRPYNGITMVDIAAEADVAVRTVQRHYRTKDDLLAACARFVEEVVGQEWGKRPTPQSAEEHLRRVVETMFALYKEYTAAVWAGYSRSTEVPELRDAFRAGVEVRDARIDELVARWPDAWASDAGHAKRTLVSLTSFPAWRGFTDRSRFTSAEATAEVTDILCQRLLRPLRS